MVSQPPSVYFLTVRVQEEGVSSLMPRIALNHFPLPSRQGVFLHRANGALIPLSLDGRHLVAFRPSLRPEDRHPFPLFGDVHHLHALVVTQFIADRLVGSSGAGKATRILLTWPGAYHSRVSLLPSPTACNSPRDLDQML